MPELWTLYRDVFALPAGHWLRVRAGLKMAEPVCWHELRAHWQGPGNSTSPQEIQEQVRQAMLDSGRAHLVRGCAGVRFSLRRH